MNLEEIIPSDSPESNVDQIHPVCLSVLRSLRPQSPVFSPGGGRTGTVEEIAPLERHLHDKRLRAWGSRCILVRLSDDFRDLPLGLPVKLRSSCDLTSAQS